MATNLTTEKIKDSFNQLLHIDGGPAAAEKVVLSAVGVPTALRVGTESISVGTVRIQGNGVTSTGGAPIFATAAQGQLADTAVQPGDLGTAAQADTGDFATAAQGQLADTALQPGAYATATQATGKATTVSLNSPAGRITMNGEELAGTATVSFTLTNNQLGANDLLLLNIAGGATAGAYELQVSARSTGSATISLTNRTVGALSEPVEILFTTSKVG